MFSLCEVRNASMSICKISAAKSKGKYLKRESSVLKQALQCVPCCWDAVKAGNQKDCPCLCHAVFLGTPRQAEILGPSCQEAQEQQKNTVGLVQLVLLGLKGHHHCEFGVIPNVYFPQSKLAIHFFWGKMPSLIFGSCFNLNILHRN